MFESLLELLKEVVPGSERYSSACDGVLPEGIGPGQGRPFSHVQEGKCDFLCISVVRSLVDCKVELDGVHSRDCYFIEAIEGFEFAELELSEFD